MNISHDSHLTDEQLIVALVDVDDLAEQRRNHLDRCRRCQDALADARRPFSRVGALAKRLTPEPIRPVRIATPVSRPWGLVSRRAALAGALCALTAVIFFWAGPLNQEAIHLVGDPNSRIADPDAVFMTEVAHLVDDPLPDRYRSLIGTAPTDSYDDFMEFIVPGVSDRAPTSSKQIPKGASPC
jgi:hypothetical protein